ncbi:MAG: ATPase, T2SS/T4P/T4SS family [Planctomycetota bacterium]
MTPLLLPILAELPVEGAYISPFKLVAFVLCFLLWAHNAGWVQSDIKKIRIPPGAWTPLVFFSGIAGLLAFLFIPLFWIGLLIFAALYGACIISYVVTRNKRVAPSETVLSMAHLGRLGKGKATAAELSAKDRVRIKDAHGKNPPWPNEPDQHAGYQALQDLLFDAIWRRASDVRMDLAPNQPVTVVYRIDGVDRAREPIAAELGPLVFVHFKRIAGHNIEERRKPQVGKFKAAIGAGGKGDKAVEVELKSAGSTAGERITFRMTSDENKFQIADIGLLKDQLEKYLALKPAKGVVVITAPKANGLTSTLYAMLRSHDAFMQNIHSLEVAKLMDLENVTQHVFDSQGGTVSFGKRLRSIIRTDPDITLAGDTPDAETAQLVAQTGKAGKRIYAGLNAKDVFSALGAYVEAVGDPALAAAGLLLVTNQRLVRLLCTHCRKAYRPDPAILKKGNLPQGEDRPFYRPPNPDEIEVDKKGNPMICAVCQGSGYLGRTGVFETLFVDEAIRAMIARGVPLATIKAEVRKKGMLFLQETALRKVYDGVTSIAEVLRVTKSETDKPASRALPV